MSHFHLFVCPLSFLPPLFLEVGFRLLPTKKFIWVSLLSNAFISILRTSLSICKNLKFWNIEQIRNLFHTIIFPSILDLRCFSRLELNKNGHILSFYHEPNCRPRKVIYNNIQVGFSIPGRVQNNGGVLYRVRPPMRASWTR